MNSQKTVNLITVCRRAGKAIVGYDAAVEEIKTGNAKCILTASDISAKTEKEIRFISDKYKIPVYKTEITREEYGHYLRKQAAVIAVCDTGFAKALGQLNDSSQSDTANC